MSNIRRAAVFFLASVLLAVVGCRSELPPPNSKPADGDDPMSFEAVETWLREMGFKRTDDGWIAEELSLLAPDRTEYKIVRRL